MKYDFNEEIKKVEESGEVKSGSSDWFKLQEGQNRLRIVSPCEKLAEKFKKGIVYSWDEGYPWGVDEDKEKGIPATRVKWLTWIIDRVDGKHKLFKIPFTLMKQIGELQANPEYEFDEMPMPYDITISVKNAGTKEVDYLITPARANKPLTEEELGAIAGEMTPAEIVQRMKDKQIAEHKENGIWVDPEERKKKFVEDRKKEITEKMDVKDDFVYPDDQINSEDIPF